MRYDEKTAKQFKDPVIQKQYDEFKEFEERLQFWMNNFYEGLGYKIINRKGNIKRDLILARSLGKPVKVEEKYRTKVWDDFLVELLQDIVPPMNPYNLGWLYQSRSEQLINIFCDSIDAEKPTKIYSVNMAKFKEQLPVLVDPKKAMEEAEMTGEGLTGQDVRWLKKNASGFESSPTESRFVISSRGRGLSLSLVIPWHILVEREKAKQLL